MFIQWESPSSDDWCSKRFVHWSSSPNLFPSRDDQNQASLEKRWVVLTLKVFKGYVYVFINTVEGVKGPFEWLTNSANTFFFLQNIQKGREVFKANAYRESINNYDIIILTELLTFS